jgi:hypothetical protein
MRKLIMQHGLEVSSYRGLTSTLYQDGSWSKDYKCDYVCIEIDSKYHEEGLILNKEELKDFIKLLKRTMREAKFNDLDERDNNEATS